MNDQESIRDCSFAAIGALVMRVAATGEAAGLTTHCGEDQTWLSVEAERVSGEQVNVRIGGAMLEQLRQVHE